MDDNKLPDRKRIRLDSYCYSMSGRYFITVCAQDKRPIFSRIIERHYQCDSCRNVSPYVTELTDLGKIVEDVILSLSSTFPLVSVPCYVIMPDHIHMILSRQSGSSQKDSSVPTIIMYLKNKVLYNARKQLGVSDVFQRSFYDHVIRSDNDYEETVKYIRNNPARRYLKNHPRKPGDD